MRLSAKLPHDLWVEIVHAAVYLHNRSPKMSLDWSSPYEAFHKYTFKKNKMTGNPVPQIGHLKAYGCLCYFLAKGKNSYRNRKLWKLDPKAFHGHLVGYVSTNIYRVWIPAKKKVVSVRNVDFNEDEFFDRHKVAISEELLVSIDDVLAQKEVTTHHLRQQLEELEPEAAVLDEIIVDGGDDDIDDGVEHLDSYGSESDESDGSLDLPIGGGCATDSSASRY